MAGLWLATGLDVADVFGGLEPLGNMATPSRAPAKSVTSTNGPLPVVAPPLLAGRRAGAEGGGGGDGAPSAQEALESASTTPRPGESSRSGGGAKGARTASGGFKVRRPERPAPTSGPGKNLGAVSPCSWSTSVGTLSASCKSTRGGGHPRGTTPEGSSGGLSIERLGRAGMFTPATPPGTTGGLRAPPPFSSSS
jgi:hypothetical protein